MQEFSIRRPRADEAGAVRQLVQTVVDETYGGQWAEASLPVGEEDWSLGWVAASATTLMGWMKTEADWIDDLWVLSAFRRQGVGSALLAHGEAEIARRGFTIARLRVVNSNARAIAFYSAKGWRPLTETPHERLPVSMLAMSKSLG